MRIVAGKDAPPKPPLETQTYENMRAMDIPMLLKPECRVLRYLIHVTSREDNGFIITLVPSNEI